MGQGHWGLIAFVRDYGQAAIQASDNGTAAIYQRPSEKEFVTVGIITALANVERHRAATKAACPKKLHGQN
jgi:hypothetical protein